MIRIDTHLHLIHPGRFAYDWTSGIPALANQAFTLDDYRRAAEGLGIRESIFMEVDVAGKDLAAEAAWFCKLAEDPANRLCGVIAACRPEHPEFERQMETLCHPRLLGFRRVLHTQPDELCTSDLFRDNIRRIGKAGLTFDLCMLPRQLKNGAALIGACPDTPFILDHCGIPDIASGDLTFWREQILEISRRPNVFCKISGIIAYGSGDITAETLRPVVEHAIECFGWDRVLWGSDWPVCNLTRDLATWGALLDEILSGCSAGELARLYHFNARTIYQLKPSKSRYSLIP
jgi:predicted TIM-barrel fold metal-dependent hydrolase